MGNQKTILWVEDFANDSDLVLDDYDPLIERTPDRTEQIKELFPSYLVDKVQVLEDPTKLPEYMKKNDKNYEFIILDINFEVGISPYEEEIQAFWKEMQEAQVNMPPIAQPDTVKMLGCYLRSYLVSKWHIEHQNIIFFRLIVIKTRSTRFRTNSGGKLSLFSLTRKIERKCGNTWMSDFLRTRLRKSQQSCEQKIFIVSGRQKAYRTIQF